MAIDVFPKHWSIIPPVTARPIRGHPLCPRFGFIFPGKTVDLVQNVIGVVASGASLYTSASCRGFAGVGREHTLTSDFDRLGDGNLLLPNDNISFVLGYSKTDGTNRTASALGGENGTGAGFIVDMNIPGSDGIVYWNWANTTTGRLTASGLTFGDDIWCFTQGPRASEIWQNGILRATMAPGPSKSTYGANTEQLALGKAQGGANTSDLAKWKFVFIYWRQLQQRDITEITRNPFQWVDPRP